jgi:hypothetical protein
MKQSFTIAYLRLDTPIKCRKGWSAKARLAEKLSCKGVSARLKHGRPIVTIGKIDVASLRGG